ncbi:class I SAM-dependent methyltransferase [Micromonospora sp. Llam7]|uniref:class I SAM-dependent methyltransferase n=1 Tax=Micromonospora tarapacensis TaxID=2835305 RepID=UPI001C8405FA|nr:class I SAM-dependent methyltransferase [Micromonospora tarapacensis]MBX7269966.1 class I SAM-dependent methyltransferase [Micromonospora tarapacensis]
MSGYSAYEAYRMQAVASLRGRVLEIGAGRGANLALLPAGVSWQGLEPDRRRHARLRKVALRHGHGSAPLRASAEDIPLPDATVDGVLSVVTLCSVDDPQLALSEVRRVLRPAGRFVFAEHVAAPAGTWSRKAQRVIAPLSRRFDHGCDPLRETESIIRRSGLEVRELRRFELPQPLGVRIPYVVGVAAR